MKRYLARNHKFYVNDGTNWLQISGIRSWTFGIQYEDADDSKFNDNGWMSYVVISRAGIINLEGFFLADSTTGERDSGQQACDNACKSLGFNALRSFKIEAFEDSTSIGYIQGSGIFSFSSTGSNVTTVLPWNTTINLLGMPVGSGIYNIFSQETYPPPASGIDRSGMWTGVLGMYTYTE